MSNQSVLVNLTGGSFTTSTLSPTDAVCQFRMNSSGVEEADEGSGFSTVATWLLGGVAGDYECRYSPTGDTGDMTGAALATWLNCGTTRFWAVTDTAGIPATKSVTGPLDIGFSGTSSALFSVTLTLTADESS